jgi:hypothetical protein
MIRSNRLPLSERMIYAIPLFGWMRKHLGYGDNDNIYWYIAAMVMLWILAIIAFGFPAVIIPALALVPTIFLALLLITRG